MKYSLRYHGRSGLSADGPYRSTLSFAPNLAREKVWMDAELRDPVRFREAISALHEVVVGDLRFKKKDKTAHQAHKQRVLAEEAQIRRGAEKAAMEEEKSRAAPGAPPPDLEEQFRRWHRVYWERRRKWAWELMRDDPELFRHLVPCDPVVTVAPDSVFFECFAKDESSYGCLLVERDSFKGHQDASLGTTNVDYSLGLYESFQDLRTYRSTRLKVDPEGFEVRTEEAGDFREEKIDLPPSWLRGFGQISAATGLPATEVELRVEDVYSVLAFLKRNREKQGPRSVRFELTPGRPPTLVIEPWELAIASRGRAWEGERATTIKIWGRRRLFALARVLPLADRVTVSLLGTGLPSIWVAHLGDMRFVLALSGWTANDWTSGANLDLLTGAWQTDERTINEVRMQLKRERTASILELKGSLLASEGAIAAALHRLAKQGQVIYDFAAGAYRYREVVEADLAERLMGPESPELTAGRQLFVRKKVEIDREESLGRGRRFIAARVDRAECEGIFDADGVLTKARCVCPHHRRFGIRKGPCRHLLALRLSAMVGGGVLSAARLGGGSFQ